MVSSFSKSVRLPVLSNTVPFVGFFGCRSEVNLAWVLLPLVLRLALILRLAWGLGTSTKLSNFFSNWLSSVGAAVLFMGLLVVVFCVFAIFVFVFAVMESWSDSPSSSSSLPVSVSIVEFVVADVVVVVVVVGGGVGNSSSPSSMRFTKLPPLERKWSSMSSPNGSIFPFSSKC